MPLLKPKRYRDGVPSYISVEFGSLVLAETRCLPLSLGHLYTETEHMLLFCCNDYWAIKFHHLNSNLSLKLLKPIDQNKLELERAIWV